MSDDDKLQEYQGKALLVRFEAARCIHSRNCVLGRPDVFVPNAPGAWIQPDAASSEAVAALAQLCPSGAITYQRLDGGEQEQPPRVNVVRVLENGPLAIRAPLRIDGQETRLRTTLCRCGHSKSKPFCDKSHEAAGFVASGEPAVGASAAVSLERRDGVLELTPQVDGPLRFNGSLEIVSGTGRTVGKVQKTALCRCGQSANKPYCDGSHIRVAFKSG
jgi:CDGSH-type Zn-finger protein/uncharacterized Fe-S cluster protein YjdI